MARNLLEALNRAPSAGQPGTVGGRFVISRRAVKLRGGVARVRVSCRTPLGCVGTLRLAVRVKAGKKTKKGKPKTKLVRIGSKKFRYATKHRNAVLKVKVTKKGPQDRRPPEAADQDARHGAGEVPGRPQGHGEALASGSTGRRTGRSAQAEAVHSRPVAKQRQTKMQYQVGTLGAIQQLEDRTDEQLLSETKHRSAARAILGARAAEKYDAKLARRYFNEALVGCNPRERPALRQLMKASLAQAERKPDELKEAMEKLGQAPPSTRQMLVLRLMGLISPPRERAALAARPRLRAAARDRVRAAGDRLRAREAGGAAVRRRGRRSARC